MREIQRNQKAETLFRKTQRYHSDSEERTHESKHNKTNARPNESKGYQQYQNTTFRLGWHTDASAAEMTSRLAPRTSSTCSWASISVRYLTISCNYSACTNFYVSFLHFHAIGLTNAKVKDYCETCQNYLQQSSGRTTNTKRHTRIWWTTRLQKTNYDKVTKW